MIDEDPSDEDIARFDRDTGYCPDCGAEVWDQAEVCPKCYAYLDGNTLAQPRMPDWVNKRWFALIAILLIIAIALTFGRMSNLF